MNRHALLIGLLSTSLTGAIGQVEQPTQSVLSQGEIYKFGVRHSGVYKLTLDFLQSIEINPSLVEVNKLQIFGHPGGRLPQANSADRPVDLQELAIQVNDGADNRLDAGDYILFYAQGPHNTWIDPVSSRRKERVNPYSDISFYYMRLGVADGKRISTAEEPQQIENEIDWHHDFQHYEIEAANLLHDANNANLQGSGQRWLGDFFRTTRKRSFRDAFDLSSAISGRESYVHMEFAARSAEVSQVILEIGQERFSKTIGRALVGNIEEDYAKFGSIMESFTLGSADDDIVVTYPDQGNNNIGWLDFIELHTERRLVYANSQLVFENREAWNAGPTRYLVEGLTKAETLWEISDPLQPQQHKFTDVSFSHNGNGTSRFVLADESTYFQPTEGGGKIENQNLHQLRDIDYLIVYHPDFTDAANKIANHRIEHSGLQVAMVTIEEVQNEFSAGKTDPTAIRDLVKMIYDRSESFRYLLLIGDGSFDYRHIYKNLNDESFIPVFETEQSMDPIFAFPTDDYYALLSNNEGQNLRGALDIAVGRLPVRTASEANIVADKIVRYETDPQKLGDWRNSVLFVADDEDGGRHLDAADAISKRVAERYPSLNISKVYMDAFLEDKTPGGEFNSNATNSLNQEIFKGKLLVNYIGHGGSMGWAQERLLLPKDIDKWNNKDRLPLLITATCSFAGYDDPSSGLTAGEYTLTIPDGGSVALFSTVRAVFAGSNERLTRSVFEEVFRTDGTLPLPIGDILINSKNRNSADTLGSNARKFTLLGDPAMRLAIPRVQVNTTRINGKSVHETNLDTVRALSKVTVEGEILDFDGQLMTGYSGTIYPTIYDKATDLRTLGQNSPERAFKLQQSVIFNGRASVNQGRFTFTFVIPKDINYIYGPGKISYYAENGTVTDAKGNFDQLIIGGTDENQIDDNEGPEIFMYLDDESFANGGSTGPDPTLYVKLSDENGINVTGNSIGHDLTGVLDNDRQNTIVMNDFYEASLDDYTSGLVTYPLSNLEPGTHTMAVKAWDILNNSSESQIEFVVADDEVDPIRRVLNYPNPFNDNTCFQFEHSYLNQDLDIRVEVYTVKGQLIKTLFQSIKPSSSLSRDIKWDGRDDFGSTLASGVYVYRIKINRVAPNGQFETVSSDLQKLVILR